MKRNHVKKWTMALLPALLVCIALTWYSDVYALSADVSLSAEKAVLDIGQEMVVTFTIAPNKPCLLQADVVVSEGVTITRVDMGGNGDYANGKFVNVSGNKKVYQGSIFIKATTAGQKSVEIKNIRLVDEQNPGDKVEGLSGRATFRVRTEEERQAAIAAYEAEQQRIREEAARRQSIEASIAASRAAEASRAAYIEQSIRESQYAEQMRQESIAASIRESEAEVERTRASEIGEYTYARIKLESAQEGEPQYFYFLISDNEVDRPEGYRESLFMVNTKEVLALRKDGMAKNTYLVYGLFENEDEPRYYYYQSGDEAFFPFDYLNEGWDDPTEPPTEPSTEASTPVPTENPTEKQTKATLSPTQPTVPETLPPKQTEPMTSLRNMIIGAVLAFFLGAAIVTFIALIAAKKKQKTAAEPAAAAEAAVPAAAPATEEKTAPKAAVMTDEIEFEDIDLDEPSRPTDRYEIDDGE